MDIEQYINEKKKKHGRVQLEATAALQILTSGFDLQRTKAEQKHN